MIINLEKNMLERTLSGKHTNVSSVAHLPSFPYAFDTNQICTAALFRHNVPNEGKPCASLCIYLLVLISRSDNSRVGLYNSALEYC